MKVIYACQTLPKRKGPRVVPDSIFLAGPTPRSDDVTSWRPEALNILEDKQFEGHVFVPEAEGGGWHGVYEEQVHWEWDALSRAACVLFWVPRDLDTLPGFTTNVEFGFMSALVPERLVLGSPEQKTPKMRYLRQLARDISRFRKRFQMVGPNDPGRILQASTLYSCLLLAVGVASS